jgi:hypothetical protein
VPPGPLPCAPQVQCSDPLLRAALQTEGAAGLWQLASAAVAAASAPSTSSSKNASQLTPAAVAALGQVLGQGPEGGQVALHVAAAAAVWQLASRSHYRQLLIQVRGRVCVAEGRRVGEMCCCAA